MSILEPRKGETKYTERGGGPQEGYLCSAPHHARSYSSFLCRDQSHLSGLFGKRLVSMPVSGSGWEVLGRIRDCNHPQNPVASQVTLRDVLRGPGRLLREGIS